MPTRINLHPRGAVHECVSGHADCKKTPSEYASSGFMVWGGEMRPTYLRSPNLCYLLCCPVPCQVDGAPVLFISASAASPYVRVCLFLVTFVFIIWSIVIIFPPLSLPSLGSLVSSLLHQLDIETLVCFFLALCR